MNPRDRRALQLGVTVVALALIGIRVLPAAIRTEREFRTRVERKLMTVELQQADLALLPMLEDSATALQAAVVQLAPRLLDAGTVSEAGAELGLRVRRAIEHQGGRVERAPLVNDSARSGGLRRASIRAEAEMDGEALEHVLTTLGRDTTVLEVSALSVNAIEPQAPPASAERLHVVLTVRGWFLERKAADSAGRAW